MSPGRKSEAGDTEWLPDMPPQPDNTNAVNAQSPPHTTLRKRFMLATIEVEGVMATPYFPAHATTAATSRPIPATRASLDAKRSSPRNR